MSISRCNYNSPLEYEVFHHLVLQDAARRDWTPGDMFAWCENIFVVVGVKFNDVVGRRRRYSLVLLITGVKN